MLPRFLLVGKLGAKYAAFGTEALGVAVQQRIKLCNCYCIMCASVYVVYRWLVCLCLSACMQMKESLVSGRCGGGADEREPPSAV